MVTLKAADFLDNWQRPTVKCTLWTYLWPWNQKCGQNNGGTYGCEDNETQKSNFPKLCFCWAIWVAAC